jgi:hypothetical protein
MAFEGGHGFLAGGGDRGDFEVGFAADNQRQTIADDPVIVDDKIMVINP